ncbi:hypothetical protein GGS23DRAFT_485640 [Durotheca rogersii]|uniref:uncharacterized protein n=1 Tax=Durotheca rogersii TaxID=419775 RepID=UPI00221FE6F9|nr:uncharacterized protein GGS23DRAFT_485640 [Durotheca rogersii]KAI5864174.1 hypothetical protein GGS23DRAFT_485640 [Durotheca rogersii]
MLLLFRYHFFPSDWLRAWGWLRVISRAARPRALVPEAGGQVGLICREHSTRSRRVSLVETLTSAVSTVLRPKLRQPPFLSFSPYLSLSLRLFDPRLGSAHAGCLYRPYRAVNLVFPASRPSVTAQKKILSVSPYPSSGRPDRRSTHCCTYTRPIACLSALIVTIVVVVVVPFLLTAAAAATRSPRRPPHWRAPLEQASTLS